MSHGSDRQHVVVDYSVHMRILRTALQEGLDETNGESTAARAARYRVYAEEAEHSAWSGTTVAHRYYYSAVAAEWRAIADELETSRKPLV